MSTNTEKNTESAVTEATQNTLPTNTEVELGTEDRPYPMTLRVREVTGHSAEVPGVLDDGSLVIKTELTEDAVIGQAFRDMPSPSMLKLFLEGCVQRETDDPRKVEFMMGDPGAGKSFLANLHAKLRTERGALLVDCGGRDLSELLYETVLDYEAGKSLYEEIDAKLAKGTMSQPSITLLQDILGEHMSYENGKYAIDWTRVNGAVAYDSASEESWKEGDEEQIAAKRAAERAQQQANMQKVLSTIEQVARMEGLGQSGSVSIGLTTKEGPLIRAWRENRPVILDEYNKAKPGTDDALQILWQVFNGEMKSHIVKGGGGKTFHFRRDEMPDKFFVTLTGNLTKDGYSTRKLSSSAYQRLQPKYIPAPSLADWQHRICQKLTGLPVSTIYAANKDYWSKHQDEFTEYLQELRTKGLTEDQKAAIAPWQTAFLENWDRVLKASELLANFYDHWAQVLDTNSELHKNPQNFGEILEELSDPGYASEVGVGLRRMMRHIDMATIIAPQAREGKAIGPRKDRSNRVQEPTERYFGSRLADIILTDINDTTLGREKLLNYLLQKAATYGGLFQYLTDVKDGNAQHKADAYLPDLLNIDPEKKLELPENMKEIHELLCDYLREKHPDLELSEENSDLISEMTLHHVLTALGGQKQVDRLITRSGVLKLPNLETGQSPEKRSESFSKKPFADAVGIESSTLVYPKDCNNETFEARYNRLAEEEQGLDEIADLPTQELADSERFLISLAVPAVKKNNLQAVFPEYIQDVFDLLESDSVQQMLNDTSDLSLAVNLLLCKTVDENGQERDEYLYLIHDRNANQGEGRTLITGTTAISPKLQSALEKSHVTYINRSDANAKDALTAALDELTAGKSEQPGNEMCIDQMLTSGLAFFRTRVPHEELPHPELLSANHKVLHVRDKDFLAKHRENLTSLLLDEGDYLEKAKGRRTPFLLTDSQDIDSLKHSLEALSVKSANKNTAMQR